MSPIVHQLTYEVYKGGRECVRKKRRTERERETERDLETERDWR
jgi:hypothetical protein